jgi:6-phosphogluconolactonase
MSSYLESLIYISSLDSGISRFRLDTESGALTYHDHFIKLAHCQFFTMDTHTLYTVHESDHGAILSAFSLENGQMLNFQQTGGHDACYITLAHQAAVVVNYSSSRSAGCVVVFPLLPDGQIGEGTDELQFAGKSVHPTRQTESHPHIIAALGDELLIADLGTDSLVTCAFEAGKLVPQQTVKMAEGAGPRYFTVHEDNLYVVNELNNTVTVHTLSLTEKQTISTLPEDYGAESYAADIHVHPSGRFLYVSNRGHDSIAAFAIGDDGALSLIGHEPTQGHFPRSFCLDASGDFLIVGNQLEDHVTVLRVDTGTGKLTATGNSVKITKPICLMPQLF